jgi:hypothetical protein
MIEPNTYPTLKPWAINMLLEWHRNDPVSNKEKDRNEAVFLIQNNRNPFIDFPELVEHIWGNKMNENFKIDIQTYNPVLITPTNDTKLDFGTSVKGTSKIMDLFVKGNNLRGENLSALLYGTNSGQFSISASSIPYLVANSSEGYCLKVTYSPKEVSNSHIANILIQGGDMTGTVLVNIFGKSIDPSMASPPIALQASNISSTGFRANWQATENTGYSIEVRLLENNDTQLIYDDDYIETTYCNISGLQAGKTYNYIVRKWINDYFSEPSNVITVNTTTSIKNFTKNNDLTFYIYKRSIFFNNKSDKSYDIEIYDIMSRLIEKKRLSFGETIVKMPYSGVFIINFGGSIEKVVVE